jgi:hypothetical protein
MTIAFAKILRLECAVLNKDGTRTKQTYDVAAQNQSNDEDVASAVELSLLKSGAKNATVFKIEVIPWAGGRLLNYAHE